MYICWFVCTFGYCNFQWVLKVVKMVIYLLTCIPPNTDYIPISCFRRTFKVLDTEPSFLVWWYILIISRSNLSIKVTGSKSLTKYWDHSLAWCSVCKLLISRLHKGQGHFKANIKCWTIGKWKVDLQLKGIVVRK